MVPAIAAKYSEINISQQSIEGVKNKNFKFGLNFLASVSVQGTWKTMGTLLSPWCHLTWSELV